MAALQYSIGDASRPAGTGPRIIAHVCSDDGEWGTGFSQAINTRWFKPQGQYRDILHRGRGSVPLGTVQLVVVDHELWVANLIASHGVRTPDNPLPLRYGALARCLSTLAQRAQLLDASLHIPRIGTGAAGGSWSQIAPLLEQEVVARGVDVTVYDQVDAPMAGPAGDSRPSILDGLRLLEGFEINASTPQRPQPGRVPSTATA